MRKKTISLTIILLGVAIIISFFKLSNKKNNQSQERPYFLAKSYWKKGYPFLVPFTKGTTLKTVVLAFFTSFEKIFIKHGKTWTLIDPMSKIYVDITFKIED